MEKIVFYACSCEELTRYACESIRNSTNHTIKEVDNCDIEQLLDDCGVIYFCDTSSYRWGKKHYGRPVISPAQLKDCTFDKVYILSFTHVNSIFRTLTQELKIPEEKIERRHIDFIYRTRERFVYTVAAFMRAHGISGNVAEGGVYKGEFSKVINDAFPESTLYLFDTFAGFDERDFQTDGHFVSATAQREQYRCFADTSIDSVLQKLPYPQNAIIRKGYFPESADGVDGQFAFVNLDFDLYAPIKAGLQFFYPKMVDGGVILVHDYFCSNFDAQRAVDEFCLENELHVLPIGDIHSVALLK